MTPQEAQDKLSELLAYKRETEWIELKEAKTTYDSDKLGEYFSALSNEANLNNKDFGWLIFGIANNGKIVGTQFRKDKIKLDSLKHEIAQKTSNGLTFIEIHTIEDTSDNRIVLFQIPPASRGIPTSWNGHYYGRDGESLVALSLNKLERIRRQNITFDWSAQICENTTIDDLDPPAIKKARLEYKNKFPSKTDDIDSWDDITFLNKAKVTVKGKITNTAILLLGREESSSLISPAVAKISWLLRDGQNHDLDYEHFSTPFLLNVDKLLANVRNLKIRHLPSGTLFPVETTKYDPWVIREALHNCIAHQDYAYSGRINVVEFPSALLFTNSGSFLPGSVEAVIKDDSPSEVYRNPFLAEAMVNLNMIDTQGGGIKKMFEFQKERYFPMPNYSVSNPDRVEAKIHGEILDEHYTKQLINQTDLDLWTAILLDKVQKNIQISKEDAKQLRSQKLIEGRYPRLFVSAKISSALDEKAKYIRNKGLDKQYYLDLILEMLKVHESATRKDINDLLLDKLSEVLTEDQKLSKIHNLLYELSIKTGQITNVDSKKQPKWVLTSSIRR